MKCCRLCQLLLKKRRLSPLFIFGIEWNGINKIGEVRLNKGIEKINKREIKRKYMNINYSFKQG